MIDQGVADALAARDADKSMNGDDNHNLGTGIRRQAPIARECTYPDFMKCKPLYFKGTKGVVELTQWFEKMESVFHISNCTVENQIKFATCTLLRSALTWWNAHVRTVGHDVAMFPKESDKIEKYVGGLPDMIHGIPLLNVKLRIRGNLITTTKLKNNLPRSKVAIAYTAGLGERKEYARTLPLRNNCKFHHNGQCTVKCANCKRVGYLTRDYRSPAATNNQRNLTCYECGNQGHYKRGGETDQYLNDMEDDIDA
ncbi:reverse transcriptase domain-containing protein [Tanacetum coccineum]